jgi:hypothetical protein
VLYYGKQTIVKVIKLGPPFLTWQISQIIVDYLFSIVITYVLNWSRGHWMLINSVIFLSLKLKEDNAPLA